MYVKVVPQLLQPTLVALFGQQVTQTAVSGPQVHGSRSIYGRVRDRSRDLPPIKQARIVSRHSAFSLSLSHPVIIHLPFADTLCFDLI